MRRMLAAVALGSSLAYGVCIAADKLELKEQKDKDSYALGFEFASNLKKQDVPTSVDVLLTGIRDAFADKQPQMSADEMRDTLMSLRQRVMAALQKKRTEQAGKNLEAAKAFLAENGKKSGVKTLPSGLQYKILKEGTGASPKATDTVTVNYRGTLPDGTEFDSSYKRGQPASFAVNRVIPGWTEALQHMKPGSKWELFVPPDLAYGERRQGAHIPPNSALIFEVELLSLGEEKKAANPAPASTK